MSELKVYHCNEWHNEYTEFYIKSEADKVIADKDKEIAELKKRIAELEAMNHDLCDRVTENDEIRLHWEEIEQTRAENERMKARIAKLEEELRWRKFPDEKPTEEMDGMDFIVSNGFFHREISEWRGYWNNDPFCGDRHCDEVKYWRTLPLEPKEYK